jgi:hypothetical protein
MVAQNCGTTSFDYYYKILIERAAEIRTTNSSLRLMALDRYSNRRHGKLELDGFMGEVPLVAQAWGSCFPFFWLESFCILGAAQLSASTLLGGRQSIN